MPIRALHDGAVRIGHGDLTQRIAIKTGDELEALGDQFNMMAARLQESYATLERKVEERTRQLELANLAKSRFLAAASHDLRQPLHALGLFVAQLSGRMGDDEHGRILARIDAALCAMNELFNALLDISKLDAGLLSPDITEFPVAKLLDRTRYDLHRSRAGKKGYRCGSFRAAPGYAATSSCLSASFSIWFRMQCATPAVAAWSSVAASGVSTCVSRFGIPELGFRRISSRTSSASSVALAHRVARGVPALVLGFPLLTDCANCSTIR